MIDLHCHIIPSVDDGAMSILETLDMMREAQYVGFTDIFATPHYIVDCTEQNSELILSKIKAINEQARIHGINVKLHQGEEVYISTNLPELLIENKVLTLGDSKYVLIELPMYSSVVYLDDLIYKIRSLGYIPIIAHPERYDYIKKDIKLVTKLKKQGVLFQGDYGSLLGKYGKDAEKTLVKLLKLQLIDFMGSDCHRKNSIYISIFDAFKRMKKIVSEEYFLKITEQNASKIIGS